MARDGYDLPGDGERDGDGLGGGGGGVGGEDDAGPPAPAVERLDDVVGAEAARGRRRRRGPRADVRGGDGRGAAAVGSRWE